jgi:SAM-dependent methyltransferase
MAERYLTTLGTASGVTEEISPMDMMFSNDREQYFKAAESGLRCIRLAMAAADASEIGSILDMACGHGLVLRMLKAAFPAAALTACDIDTDGVDFCAATFGATPVYSKEEPDQLEIDDSFDLIWSGSLLTHLDEARFGGFLALFERLLAPGGLLVFTTAGRRVANTFRNLELKEGWRFTDEAREAVEAFDRVGFGFVEQKPGTRFGHAFASPAWVCGQVAQSTTLRLVSFTECGFGAHGRQDVVACVKTPASMVDDGEESRDSGYV